MHRTAAGCLIVCLFSSAAFALIPLPVQPDWESQDNDYATGGSWSDIDNDGWLDLVTSNGNDMAQNSNSVYYNVTGRLQTLAGWRSADLGYFGHCYTGDIDNDGDIDLVVAYLGTGTVGEFRARLYRNVDGTLDALPAWKSADRHCSFDCCLGDVDLDGDLDLAISAGDAYQNQTDSARIYFNSGGTFDTLPGWTAHSGHPSDAVRLCDVDNDGDLDLFVGQVVPNEDRGFVTMYRNDAGVIDPVPAWTAHNGIGWVLRLAFGDIDQDGWPDLAVASNNQTGGPNSIKVFRNRQGALDTVAAYTLLSRNRYSACVAWADLTGDGFPELAAGGWWEPAVVFENQTGLLDTVPGWQSQNNSTLVCEALVLADSRNRYLFACTDTFVADGSRRLWTLRRYPAQFLDSLTIDGVRLPTAAYCYDLLAGWFSLSAAPLQSSTVICHYRYSGHCDLAVTNWDRARGNRLYLNTTPTAIDEHHPLFAAERLRVNPNPFQSLVRFSTSDSLTGSTPLRVIDPSGRVIESFVITHSPFIVDLSRLVPGIYLVQLGSADCVKLIRTTD